MTRLFIDTETTGPPPGQKYPGPVTVPAYGHEEKWPRVVQVVALLYHEQTQVAEYSCLVEPEGFQIPSAATEVHGITTSNAQAEGVPLSQVLDQVERVLELADVIVAHNAAFDINVLAAEYFRQGWTQRNSWDATYSPVKTVSRACTMKSSNDLCALPRSYGSGYKWPTLDELHQHLFGTPVANAHDARADVKACARSFFEMRSRGLEIHA